MMPTNSTRGAVRRLVDPVDAATVSCLGVVPAAFAVSGDVETRDDRAPRRHSPVIFPPAGARRHRHDASRRALPSAVHQSSVSGSTTVSVPRLPARNAISPAVGFGFNGRQRPSPAGAERGLFGRRFRVRRPSASHTCRRGTLSGTRYNATASQGIDRSNGTSLPGVHRTRRRHEAPGSGAADPLETKPERRRTVCLASSRMPRDAPGKRPNSTTGNPAVHLGGAHGYVCGRGGCDRWSHVTG